MTVYGTVLVGVGLVLCCVAPALTLWAVAEARKHAPAGRRLGRFMITTSALALPIVMSVSSSDVFEPMFPPIAPVLGVPLGPLSQVAALIAYVVGLAWMIRIYRTSHLEPEGSSWRYREA
jgi:hypothetical protein